MTDAKQTIREAFKRVLEDVQYMAEDGLICNVMDDIIYVNARKALAALSTIDPEAIRRDVLEKIKAKLEECHGDTPHDEYEEGYKDGTENAIAIIDAFILGAEPAQEDGEACRTCGKQCPNDCPMDKEAGE